MYTDMFEVPTFFYFLPLYAFLFGYFSVNSSRVQEGTHPEAKDEFNKLDILRRLNRLDKKVFPSHRGGEEGFTAVQVPPKAKSLEY